MDIRKWNVDQIMQLPEYLFGQKYVLTCGNHAEEGAYQWDMSVIKFPDPCVIWGIGCVPSHVTFVHLGWKLALGTKLPTATAEFQRLDPLIPGIGFSDDTNPTRMLRGRDVNGPYYIEMKYYRVTMAQNLVIETYGGAGQDDGVGVWVAVTAIPREIPDWFFKRSE